MEALDLGHLQQFDLPHLFLSGLNKCKNTGTTNSEEIPLQMVKGCPDLNRLSAFSEGLLSRNDYEKLLAHFRICNDCMELLTTGMDVYGELPPEVLNAAAPVWES